MGQRGGAAECLADHRGGLAGLSLRASRDLPAVRCLCLTLAAGLCLSGHDRGMPEAMPGQGRSLFRMIGRDHARSACAVEYARDSDRFEGDLPS